MMLAHIGIAVASFTLGVLLTSISYSLALQKQGLMWDGALRMWRWADKNWGYCPRCSKKAV